MKYFGAYRSSYFIIWGKFNALKRISMRTGFRYLCITIIALLAKASTAQVGNCDSLQVLDFQLNPFNTEQLVLRSAYTDFDNFINYPGFSVVNEDQFILAQEEVNFFGMSTEQVHLLDILDMEVTEGDSISGDLELWSFFYENLECVLPGPFLLWPEQECVPLRLTVNVYEADSASGNMSWQILNDGGELLESHIFELDTMPGLFHVDFCLPPGCGYALNIETVDLMGSGMAYSLHYGGFLAVGASGTFTDDGEDNHAFDLYNCLGTGREDVDSPEFTLYPNPGTDRVYLELENAQLPHSLYVTDLTGREVAHIENPKDRLMSIDCSQWPSGIYLVSVVQGQKEVGTKKLVITR